MVTYLQDLVASLLGSYSPIYYTDPTTNEIIASVDWGYITSAVIFIVCLWSCFRLLGGLLCSNR